MISHSPTLRNAERHLVVGYFEKSIFLNAKIPENNPPRNPIGNPTKIVRIPPAILPGSPRRALITKRGITRQMRNIAIPATIATKRRSVKFT